ncbi:DUF2975 domain-containing protein [Streptomyces physcomitrii]|uniref:DUF2975 domain-containing protein n=1 Tax=Streptomyces physcomitrii TaxID=2724184 RepID=A0ABX1HBP0_9ACTN|nr:DUF2975 domain-containing protein [Streptomyces physcomitrii]NKI45548.1 DUF2975 domain-containing protein [Streptomyces physcomitrii]
MTPLLTRSLRAALCAVFALTLALQAWTVVLVSTDPAQDVTASGEPVAATDDGTLAEIVQGHGLALALCALPALLLLQAVVVCVWRLTGLAQDGKAFTPASLPYLTTTIRALIGMTVLLAALAFRLGSTHALPLTFTLYPYGAALAAATGALVMLLLRTLLHEAIHRDGEATRLRGELAEVI